MKYWTSIFLFFVIIFHVFPQSFIREEIIGGTTVEDITAYPFAVQLTTRGSSQHTCSGVLLGDKWVLTAAHCINGYAPLAYKVIGGSTFNKNVSSNYQSSYVKRIISHEGYLKDHPDDDIAFIELEKPFEITPYLNPIQILESDHERLLYMPGTNLTVLGWGRDNRQSNSTALKLNKADLSVLDTSNSFVPIILNNTRAKNKIIASFRNQLNFLCHGDSGGPLIYIGEDSIPKLAGISSAAIELPFSFSCEGGIGVFSSAVYHAGWIKSTIARDEQKDRYMPFLKDITINDTVYTCGGQLSPLLNIYNFGSLPFNSVRVKATLTSKDSKEVINQVIDLKRDILNNWLIPVEGLLFSVKEEQDYHLSVELLNLDGTPLDSHLQEPIEKTFFVAKGSYYLYINYEGINNRLYYDFNLYHFNQIEDARQVLYEKSIPFFSKLYFKEDFKLSKLGVEDIYILKDSFCVAKSCFSFKTSLRNPLLFQKTSSSVDTLFSNDFKHGSSYNNFCMQDPECLLANETVIGRTSGCKDIIFNPRSLVDIDRYKFSWFNNDSGSIMSTDDTILAKEYKTHYLFIEDKSIHNCVSIGAEIPRFYNISIPVLYKSSDRLFAYVRNGNATPVWYLDGQEIENDGRHYLDAKTAGRYHFNYYTMEAGTDTCWSHFQSNSINVVFEQPKPEPKAILPYNVFPVPAYDQVFIRSPLDLSGKLFLIDIKGRIILETDNIKMIADQPFELKLPEMSAGIFILKFLTENATYISRFSKY